VRNLLSRLGVVWPDDSSRPGAAPRLPPPETHVTAKALRKFLTCLEGRPAPVLLDLGPVVGSNVTFFGERLNCKVYIENLLGDLERHTRDGRVQEFPTFLADRFHFDEGGVDGILLWDVYDFLDRPSAHALAKALTPLLRTGGALLGFFGTGGEGRTGFTKYIVSDETHVRPLAYASPLVRRTSPPNREILQMFDGLRVTESFLLHDGLREILFRKS
jgi:hypothetical protein